MLALVIAACLATAGSCRDFQLLYDPREVSLMTCVTVGQAEIARWKESHAAWTVRRWSCGYRRSPDQPARRSVSQAAAVAPPTPPAQKQSISASACARRRFAAISRIAGVPRNSAPCSPPAWRIRSTVSAST